MKKLLVSLAIATPLFAAAQSDIADRYFNPDSPELTAQEKAALAISRDWQAGKTKGSRPVAGGDGKVQFIFGVTQPSIVCAVLQVCDIALQPGEQVNSINIGDSARWLVEPAITGSGASEIQHLIIKPMDVGLETSMVITTDRRTYHIRLRSHRTKYMPQVSFVYPEEAHAKWDAIRRRQASNRADNTLPATGEYIGNLDFEYDISGNTNWKPVRVYNDGRKTVIEMPREMQNAEAPSLLVVRKAGGLFRDEETVMVNYRLQGNRYIVDTVFNRAILIAGVGRSQDRVTISRRKQ